MAAAVPVAGGSVVLLRSGRVLVVAVAVGCVVLAIAGLPPSESLATTYAAVSPTARAAGLVAGGSLLAAGAVAAWCGPSRSAGVLLVGAGALWFAPDWAGWEGGPAVVRGLATLLVPLLPVVLWGLLATLPGGSARRTVVAAAVVAVLSVGLATVDDPFLDPMCWPTCSESALLITSRPELAAVLAGALALSWAAISGVALGGAARRLLTASRVARRWNGVLLGAFAVAAAVEASYGLVLLLAAESADDPLFLGLNLGRAAAWSLVAVAAARTTYRHLARGRALSHLAAELETTSLPGSLAGTLRSLTGDPELGVRYPVGHDGRMVTADGRAVESVTDPGRTATPLRRGDRTVAVLVHDPVGLPVEALDAVLGAAARLALENERLAAERLARVHDVQESQRRIVVTADEARRRLEHDLHDGAQQSLLALSLPAAVGPGVGRAGRGARRHRRTRPCPARGAGRARRPARARARHPPGRPLAVRSGRGAALAGRGSAVAVELGRSPPSGSTRASNWPPTSRPRLRDAAAGSGHVLSVPSPLRRGDLLVVTSTRRAGARARRQTADRVGALGGGSKLDARACGRSCRAGSRRRRHDAHPRGHRASAERRRRRGRRCGRATPRRCFAWSPHGPDAVIVDIRMPPTHTDEGVVAAQRIRARAPGTGVLVLSQLRRAELRDAAARGPPRARRLPAQGARLRRGGAGRRAAADRRRRDRGRPDDRLPAARAPPRRATRWTS